MLSFGTLNPLSTRLSSHPLVRFENWRVKHPRDRVFEIWVCFPLSLIFINVFPLTTAAYSEVSVYRRVLLLTTVLYYIVYVRSYVRRVVRVRGTAFLHPASAFMILHSYLSHTPSLPAVLYICLRSLGFSTYRYSYVLLCLPVYSAIS